MKSKWNESFTCRTLKDEAYHKLHDALFKLSSSSRLLFITGSAEKVKFDLEHCHIRKKNSDLWWLLNVLYFLIRYLEYNAWANTCDYIRIYTPITLLVFLQNVRPKKKKWDIESLIRIYRMWEEGRVFVTPSISLLVSLFSIPFIYAMHPKKIKIWYFFICRLNKNVFSSRQTKLSNGPLPHGKLSWIRTS